MEQVVCTTCSDSEDDTAQEVDECMASACTVNLSQEGRQPGKQASPVAQSMKRKLTEDRQSQVSEVVIKVENPPKKPKPGVSEECVGSSTDPSCSQCDQAQDGEEAVSCSEDKEGYQCLDCNLTFTSLLLLNLHLRSDHIMMDSFKCTACNENFPDPDSVSQHWSKIHKSCKLYPCTECNLVMKSAKALNQHQSSYHSTMSIKCYLCFSLRSRLKEHNVTVHNTSKLFSCSDCMETFIDFARLMKHRKVHMHQCTM